MPDKVTRFKTFGSRFEFLCSNEFNVSIGIWRLIPSHTERAGGQFFGIEVFEIWFWCTPAIAGDFSGLRSDGYRSITVR